MGKKHWRCFFCDELFSRHADAALHFGGSILQEPICRVAAQEGGLVILVRELEERVEDLRQEISSDENRHYAREAAHASALRREEERGYERGLRDGQEIARDAVRVIQDLLVDYGHAHMSDDDLRHEYSLGNQHAPLILRARAAILAFPLSMTEPEAT